MNAKSWPPCPDCNGPMGPGKPPEKYRRALQGKTLWHCADCIQAGEPGTFVLARNKFKERILAAFPEPK